MIARVWHGWALPAGADAYERYYREALTAELLRTPGCAGGHLLRRESADEVELCTVTWFHSMAAVRGFAGDDCDRAVVSEHARSLLTRWEGTVQHYAVVASSSR